jgi:hypothetical protein
MTTASESTAHDTVGGAAAGPARSLQRRRLRDRHHIAALLYFAIAIYLRVPGKTIHRLLLRAPRVR